MNRTLKSIAAGVIILCLSACSNMNSTQQRTLSGAAIGAGVGTAATLVTGGCITCGAVVGGAVGAGAGYVYDKTR
jgi:osmotically inducible lipoprotein OsmB